MVFELLKSAFLGVFADLECSGAFDWLIRHSSKRVIIDVSQMTGNTEYFPQWRFLWWHYDYKEVGYQTLSPISFIYREDAIEHAQMMGINIPKPKKDVPVVWSSEAAELKRRNDLRRRNELS